MIQMDLLDYKPAYPATAGFKAKGASLDAALRITLSGKKDSIEKRVMDFFACHGGQHTADEVALRLEIKTKNLRPRFSELCIDKLDKHGNIVRKAYLRKTTTIIEGASEDGMGQHAYERIV